MEPAGWQLTDDLAEFLRSVEDFQRSRPALHTVTLTVSEGLRTRGPYAYGAEPPRFGVLRGAVRATLLHAEVLLLTDLADPVAGRLYQRLGYRPVADFATWTFTAPEG